MKKGLKLGIAAMTMAAMAGTIGTMTVKATDVTNTVSVEIIESGNTCTLGDYNWGQKNASTESIPLEEKTQTLKCELLRNAGGTITMTLSDLVGAQTATAIEKSNFNVALSGTIVNGSLDNESEVASTSFGTAQDAYTKGDHKVGTMERVITLSGSINAGQAVDTYTGTLNVFVPNA